MPRATLHVDMVRMTLQPAIEPIRLVGRGAIVDVEYSYTPADPGDAESTAFCTPTSAKLVRPLVLRDGDDAALLMLSIDLDIMPSLLPQQVEWIAENLPMP